MKIFSCITTISDIHLWGERCHFSSNWTLFRCHMPGLAFSKYQTKLVRVLCLSKTHFLIGIVSLSVAHYKGNDDT